MKFIALIPLAIAAATACDVTIYSDFGCTDDETKVVPLDSCIETWTPFQGHSFKPSDDCPELQSRCHQSGTCNDANAATYYPSGGECQDVETGQHWGSSRFVFTGF